MFGRYALTFDDLAGTYASVLSSAPDPEYPAEYIAAMSNTGHLNLPSRPSKLLTTAGYWELSYASAITVVAAALIYHNFDEGLPVTLEGGGGSPAGFTIDIPIPAPHVSSLGVGFTGWTVSPWVEFDSPQTFDLWRLSVNDVNSYPCQVGRLMLLTTLRTLGRDVRYGVDEMEEFRYIEHPTELGIPTMYDLGGKERGFAGEFALNDTQAQELIDLHRSAHGRIMPWLLIPDANVNDAWLVRFEENRWNRMRETLVIEDGIESFHNIMPYKVREVSRGLPWP